MKPKTKGVKMGHNRITNKHKRLLSEIPRLKVDNYKPIANDYETPGKITKALRKELKQIAAQLFPQKYAAYQYGENESGNYSRKIECFPVNHANRMEQAFKTQGRKVIADYIKKHTEQNKPL